MFLGVWISATTGKTGQTTIEDDAVTAAALMSEASGRIDTFEVEK
jgi:hypothetical protein